MALSPKYWKRCTWSLIGHCWRPRHSFSPGPLAWRLAAAAAEAGSLEVAGLVGTAVAAAAWRPRRRGGRGTGCDGGEIFRPNTRMPRIFCDWDSGPLQPPNRSRFCLTIEKILLFFAVKISPFLGMLTIPMPLLGSIRRTMGWLGVANGLVSVLLTQSPC